jgi:hypothetical protein
VRKIEVYSAAALDTGRLIENSELPEPGLVE